MNKFIVEPKLGDYLEDVIFEVLNTVNVLRETGVFDFNGLHFEIDYGAKFSQVMLCYRNDVQFKYVRITKINKENNNEK